MKLRILTYPHPALRKKAKPVNRIDESIRHLARAMLGLMYKENGVGLAATQVGKLVRLIVINTTKKPTDEIILINPRIEKTSGLIQEPEGCLSFPGLSARVSRHKRIICRATDINGKEIFIDTGLTVSDDKKPAPCLLSRVIQHEIDHLDGIVFIDHLSPEDKESLSDALRKLK